MNSRSGYDVRVRPSFSASIVLFSVFALPAFFVSGSQAQINGAPASVTSPGFGGHAVNGPRASVTSVGPNGYAPGPGVSFGTGVPFDGHHHDGTGNGHHHGNAYPPAYYAVPVPYAVDLGATEEQQESEATTEDQDSSYQGGPTVFDRRGSGRESYVPPVHDLHPPHFSERGEDAAPAPLESLDPTTLVFKDGHKLEVANYAIIGPTLFDMTPGHSRKVPLVSLDLEATRRTNDEHGVTFQLPISSQAN